MLIPLKNLYDASGRISPPGIEEWYYGGVADALAVQQCGSRWILDHKTVERFYLTPAAFSLEQLGMYCVAYEILNKVTLTGGIISRVKQLEAHPTHILNYVLKQIPGLTKAIIKNLQKSSEKQTPPSTVLNLTNNNITSNNITNSNIVSTGKHSSTKVLRVAQKPKLVKIKLRSKGLRLGITSYDSNNCVIQSIQDMRGNLIHVERHYYPLTRVEKQEIVKDFLRYAEEIILNQGGGQEPEQNSRRTPGLHCNWCPFQKACEAERLTGGTLGSMIDQKSFTVALPNQELISKLEENI